MNGLILILVFRRLIFTVCLSTLLLGVCIGQDALLDRNRLSYYSLGQPLMGVISKPISSSVAIKSSDFIRDLDALATALYQLANLDVPEIVGGSDERVISHLQADSTLLSNTLSTLRLHLMTSHQTENGSITGFAFSIHYNAVDYTRRFYMQVVEHQKEDCQFAEIYTASQPDYPIINFFETVCYDQIQKFFESGKVDLVDAYMMILESNLIRESCY